MVDERGAVVILRNNTPRGVLIDINELDEQVPVEIDASGSRDRRVEESARHFLQKYHRAFEELAK